MALNENQGVPGSQVSNISAHLNKGNISAHSSNISARNPKKSVFHAHLNKQALRYRIWDLGLGSKTRYKGKINELCNTVQI